LGGQRCEELLAISKMAIGCAARDPQRGGKLAQRQDFISAALDLGSSSFQQGLPEISMVIRTFLGHRV
jgi:hypothetical protein